MKALGANMIHLAVLDDMLYNVPNTTTPSISTALTVPWIAS